jgi:hypothetical protein
VPEQRQTARARPSEYEQRSDDGTDRGLHQKGHVGGDHLDRHLLKAPQHGQQHHQ